MLEKNGNIATTVVIIKKERIKNIFINTGKILFFKEKVLRNPIKKEKKKNKVVTIDGLIPKGDEITIP